MTLVDLLVISTVYLILTVLIRIATTGERTIEMTVGTRKMFPSIKRFKTTKQAMVAKARRRRI